MPPLTRLALRLALTLSATTLTFPNVSLVQEQPVSILSSCWTSPNEGLPQIIKILDMKAVWALLLLFLSQADTYIGRHSEPDPGLIKADSRQDKPCMPYSSFWVLCRQGLTQSRPSIFQRLSFRIRQLLGFNPRGVKSVKRTLRLPRLRLPRLRLPRVTPLRL